MAFESVLICRGPNMSHHSQNLSGNLHNTGQIEQKPLPCPLSSYILRPRAPHWWQGCHLYPCLPRLLNPYPMWIACLALHLLEWSYLRCTFILSVGHRLTEFSYVRHSSRLFGVSILQMYIYYQKFPEDWVIYRVSVSYALRQVHDQTWF